jgi:threonyl-tRNA synthetase
MRRIIAAREAIRTEVWDRERAVAHYEAAGEPFKVELIDRIPRMRASGCTGTATGRISAAGRTCSTRGSFRRTRGSSWACRGLLVRRRDRPQLQRITGVAFRTRDDLKAHLTMLEEAAKRDHRKLGREMELFHLQEEAPGMVFWHPNGWTVYRTLEDYMRRRLRRAGYKEIRRPRCSTASCGRSRATGRPTARTCSSWRWTRRARKEKRINALKPMNCPCHVQVYNQGLKSYRDLPLRLASSGPATATSPRAPCTG